MAGPDEGAPTHTFVASARSSIAHLTATTRTRAATVMERVDRTTAGGVRRRVNELEVMNQALILSALALMLFIPALVTLAAVLPVASNHGLAANFARHLGLSSRAVADVQKLFGSRDTVRSSTTAIGAVVTILFAYGWPVQLQRGYELIWGLPQRGFRDLWRPFVWLASFFSVVLVVSFAGRIASGLVGALETGALIFPLTFAWAWWTQHLLLAGRIAWRTLVAGGLATALGLYGLSVAMTVYLSPTIVSNSNRYGPIGVVFALLSYMIGFSVVMLGGPLVGHTIFLRREPADPAITPSG